MYARRSASASEEKDEVGWEGSFRKGDGCWEKGPSRKGSNELGVWADNDDESALALRASASRVKGAFNDEDDDGWPWSSCAEEGDETKSARLKSLLIHGVHSGAELPCGPSIASGGAVGGLRKGLSSAWVVVRGLLARGATSDGPACASDKGVHPAQKRKRSTLCP